MKPNRGIRALGSIALLTIISGAVMSLVGASTVRSAQDAPATQQAAVTQPSTAQTAPAQSASAPIASASNDQANSATSGNTDDSCLTDPAVLAEISQKKQELDQQAKDLAAKQTELKARESAIADEMQKLETLRDQIVGTQKTQKKAEADKVAKIVATLEGMSPKAAAQMLTDMDDGLAVSAISQMSTTKLSKVMNTLDPQRAAHLTELLAGVVRAKNSDASNGASATTNIAKGGENNDKQHQQPESIISGGPQQFAARGPSGQSGSGTQ